MSMGTEEAAYRKSAPPSPEGKQEEHARFVWENCSSSIWKRDIKVVAAYMVVDWLFDGVDVVGWRLLEPSTAFWR